MAENILEIAENDRHLCVQRGHVLIQQSQEVLGRITIDSLAAVILSADNLTLSKHFLARMAEEGIPVITCGKNYLPLSMALPHSDHYKQLAVVTSQLSASPVLKKQLWQAIITAKIRNQAHTLAVCQPHMADIAADLLSLAKKVRSGDPDNKEGQAARRYWPALMGKNFLRDTGADGINTFLNYGYAIVRAACARALCGSGLLPVLGLHHHNIYNAFCLADDIMEPLRPYLDQLVFTCTTGRDKELTLDPKGKRDLIAILRTPLPFCGEERTLSSAATLMAQGLTRSYTSGVAQLPLPGHD